MVKSVRTVLGLTMVLGALAACDDNPMKDARDEGEYFFKNPSFSTIVAGDTVQVTAQVRNRYLAPTGAAVTATPCDSRITAAADTTRTEFEAPERFWVRAVGLGRSCLVVTGGGVTDTIDFLVGPAGITVFAGSPLGSGESGPVRVTFQNLQGADIAGLDSSNVTITSSNSGTLFYDPATFTMTGRAPGTAGIVAILNSGLGQSVRDTAFVTVVAAAFNGTATAMTEGALVTLTAGTIPFDADTKVRIGGDSAFVNTVTATTLTAVVPVSTTPTAQVVISNMGPNQVAQQFTAAVADQTGEPDDFGATARPITLGTVYGVISQSDDQDWYRLDVTAASQTVGFNLAFPGTGVAAHDVDVVLYNSAGTHLSFTTGNCESLANPEVCTRTFTTGTYYIQVANFSTQNSTPYRLRLQ